MDASALPAAVGAPVCAFLALLFLTTAARGYRPRPYGSLGWLALLGAFHLAAYWILRTAEADEKIILATKLVTAGTLVMGPAWMQLVLAFLEKPFSRWLFPLYGIAFLFLALLGGEWLLASEVIEFGKLGITRQAAPGPIYAAHLVFFIFCVVAGLALLGDEIRLSIQHQKKLPLHLADTFAEEGVPIIAATAGGAALIGIVDGFQLFGWTSFQIPIELGELILIGGSAYATAQRFPKLLLRVEEQLEKVKALNVDLEARNREIKELAKKNEELMAEEIRSLKTELAEVSLGASFGDMVGKSLPMRRVFEVVAKVAPQEATVLVLGESGVGKERIAREIHRLSPRSGAPFYAVNVGALTETLLESELFGHTRGAFTGAVSDRPGMFRAANGGTLFLDEIGEMAKPLQVKLLRVLQEREVTPLGGTKSIPVDVRVVAATNRDLTKEVESGRFREDLYYRLNVITIQVPPLRERPDDVEVLALHFLKQHAEKQKKNIRGISETAKDALLAYSWPGNVRELANVIERAVTLCDGDLVHARDLPSRLVESQIPAGVPAVPSLPSPNPGNGAPPEITLEELEKKHILGLLERHGGQRTKVAEILGINPSTLYRKLKSYGIGE
ncbi:MAG: sigma 54-interacting transcriptional regulator [Bdellovibrionota bacterium]